METKQKVAILCSPWRIPTEQRNAPQLSWHYAGQMGLRNSRYAVTPKSHVAVSYKQGNLPRPNIEQTVPSLTTSPAGHLYADRNAACAPVSSELTFATSLQVKCITCLWLFSKSTSDVTNSTWVTQLRLPVFVQMSTVRQHPNDHTTAQALVVLI